MTEHPRDCCQTCGKKSGGGGEDVVLYLRSPLNSFHHWKHMACFEREVRTDEREACAKEALAEAEHWEEGESGWAACTTIAIRIQNRT